MVRTSGFLEGRYRLYLRTETAEGLSPDTRVYVQGLAVGRVHQVSPALDPATNRLSFVVTLSVMDAFPGGAELRLPVGTRGVILQPGSFVGGHAIDLELPTDTAARAFLEPGDTIPSRRVESVTSVLARVAGQLHEEIATSLSQTRELITKTNGAVDAATDLLASAGPDLLTVLDELAVTLRRTDSLLVAVEPRVYTIADTLLATLSETRDVLARFDTLAHTAHLIASENRTAVSETIERLQRAAITLEHFTERVSRRPMRLLTGVTPPAVDTTEQEP